MSMTAPLRGTALSYVETTLNFAHPDSETRLLDETDRTKSVKRREQHRVRVHDARPVAQDFTMEKNGFELIRRVTACKEFYDAEHVRETYFPEIESLIKERTGAERVLIFGPALRTDNPARSAGVRLTAAEAHVDYSEKMVRYFIREMLGEAEAERLSSRRFMLINVWRPLVTVERSPLALCDAATVKRDDLVLAYVKGSVFSKPGAEPFTSEGYNLFFNPAQRWYYFPRLEADEALVFRLCDSDRHAIQLTAHTAFEDPTSPPDAAYRQSYEIRTIAIMPE